jgi:hypothetical protein
MSIASWALLVQATIGTVFAVSVLQKVRRPMAFIHGVREYRLLPEILLAPVAVALMVLEAFVALTHLTGWMLRYGSMSCVLLLSVFLAVVGSALLRKIPVTCHCFGSAKGEWISAQSVIRIVLLLAAEASLLFGVMLSPIWPLLHELGAMYVLYTGIATILLLAFVSWVMAAADLRGIVDICLKCRSMIGK